MQNILQRLQDHLSAASWSDVAAMADATGVPIHTIAKIKRGETQNPRVRTVEALLAHISKRPAAKSAGKVAV